MNCVICERECGSGNNAMPVAPGRCCNRCDDLLVTPARLAARTGEKPADFFEIAVQMHAAAEQLRRQHHASR